MEKSLIMFLLFIITLVILKRNLKNFNIFLIKFYASFLIYWTAGIIFIKILYLFKESSFFKYLFLNNRYYIFTQGLTSLVILFFVIQIKNLKKIFYEYKNLYFFKGLKLYLLSSLIILLLSIILKKVPIENNFIISIIKNEKSVVCKFYFYFIICILSPIIEEIIFRVILLKGLSEKFNKTEAVLYGSLLFSLMHMDMQNLIYYFIYGILYSLYYLRYNNIYPTMTAHIINNSISFYLI